MIVFDTRMVTGHPLQYYSPNSAEQYYQPLDSQYSYFNKYEFYSMTNISEEMIMPSSPNSIQSDSDNSLSSTDVNPSPITSVIPLTSPTKTTTKKTDIKCGWRQCGLWFESLDQLATHVSKAHASSGPSGLFYCGWEGCARNNKGFNARYKMLVHVRTHTNEKPHQCCQCAKSFSRAENLKIHSRSHSGEKPYVCPVPGCNKAYSNSSDRFKHTRTHQVEKPYLCKVPGCPKRYTDPSSLRKHVKTYKHYSSETKIENGAETAINKPSQLEFGLCQLDERKLSDNSAEKVQNGNLTSMNTLNPFLSPGEFLLGLRDLNSSDLRNDVKAHYFLNEENKLGSVASCTNPNNLNSLNSLHNTDKLLEKNLGLNLNSVNISNKNLINLLNKNESLQELSKDIYTEENIIKAHSCSCPHTCCLKSCLSKAADFLKLGALINFSGVNFENVIWKNENLTWNKMLFGPFVDQSRNLHPGFENGTILGCKEEEEEWMDVDTPLDLTVHRK